MWQDGCKPPLHPSIYIPRPFKPTASLPTKVVKQILELDFVEMSEVMVHADEEPQRPVD